jgi:pyrimidine-nucleoside phosphorylase
VNVVRLIAAKKAGRSHSAEELRALVSGYLAGEIPDYQMSAWLMAVCWRGMHAAETQALTEAMVASGETLDWSHLDRPAVDKHSTGGVGDKTSLVLVPLMAAAGYPCVKMSGRGLGHTGGTIDKLESIQGFRVELSPREMREQVARIGCALVGQGPGLVPADGRLYALRDVTATVESVPLIASSIMSKKLAAGAPVIVLDVKYGSGAFMDTVDAARELARRMVAIGNGAGRKVRAVLSSMEEPLGRAVGNALEVREAIETLQGDGPDDLWALTLELGAHQLVLAGGAASVEEATERLREVRESGAALAKLAELIRAQGGDDGVLEDPDLLPRAAVIRTVALPGDAGGVVTRVDARRIADAALALGAGRRTKEDTLDLSVGVRLLAQRGDAVSAGDPVVEIHAASDEDARDAERLLLAAFEIGGEPPPSPRYEVVS